MLLRPVAPTQPLGFISVGLRFMLETLASSVGPVYLASIGLVSLPRIERETGTNEPASPIVRALGEPYFLLAILIGILLGLLVNRFWRHSSSRWVWVCPALWLAYEILETSYWGWYRHFPDPAEPLAHMIWNNFFGADCSGSECVYEWMATAPFYASVAYSLMTWILYGRSTQAPAGSIGDSV